MGATSISRIRPIHYRAVFISDVHLGFAGCSADYLLDFLRSTTCDYLYLVGDIIDVWQMKKRLYWPQAHNDVIRTILGKAKHGTQVIYVPGNHDELLRDFDGMHLGNLRIENRCIHTTRHGQRFLVMHGDEFDAVVRSSRLLALIGSRLYQLLIRVSTALSYVRRRLGFSYWSLAAELKHKVKRAVNYISNFETALAHAAHQHQVQGLVSGHIHRAEITTINDIIYCNCGDWVESCTALVERQDGALELLAWTEERICVKTLALAAA
jgi:UDP-2,3-diacylglucosamine pyrophosphatase LpxH